MKKIYLDNGSTSFPKAPGVGAAMGDFIEKVGVNIARGGYEEAYCAAERVLETREMLCRQFGFDKPENVIFQSGITAGLNLILKGFLRPGMRVITSSMEHNAVMRPLHQLGEAGVEVQVVPCEADGSLPLPRLEQALAAKKTDLVVLTHGSNVCGTLLPIREAAALAHRYGAFFVVDAAQTGGVFPIEMKAWDIDAVAFAGHKGLLGPQGIGGFLITTEFSKQIEPLLAGGTGSRSHEESMPAFLPDRFEAGTQNLPGIMGLHAALSYLEQETLAPIRAAKQQRTRELLEGFAAIDGVRLVGKPGLEGRTAVVSVDFKHIDNAEAAFLLESEYGIMTRCGLHCAPRAHQTLGTYPQGTVRFAPGHTTTAEETAAAVKAVQAIAKARP